MNFIYNLINSIIHTARNDSNMEMLTKRGKHISDICSNTKFVLEASRTDSNVVSSPWKESVMWLRTTGLFLQSHLPTFNIK